MPCFGTVLTQRSLWQRFWRYDRLPGGRGCILRSMQLAEMSYRGGRVAILEQGIVEYIRRVTALPQLSAETQRQMFMRNFRGDLSVRQVLVAASEFAHALFDIRVRFGATFSSSQSSAVHNSAFGH